MLHAVGIQARWHVLDAGCGAGGFLPLLAELVGPASRVTALDLAPDNVAVVQDRIAAGQFACHTEADRGSLTALPYPERHFDAVWCANTLQYLTDAELAVALGEFRRVVHPGGVVAIKEHDVGLLVVEPLDPALLWHIWEAGRDRSTQIRGYLRGRRLRGWLERSGLVAVWQRAVPDEHRAPLSPLERRYFGSVLAYWATLAEQAGVPEADRVFWRTQADPSAVTNLASDPDFYYCEGHYLAVGRVPEGAGKGSPPAPAPGRDGGM
jgi:SAM-dependent methyltransferase